MKKINLIVALICSLCLSSCVYSLFPIYTEESIVFLPELLGKWSFEDSEITFMPIQKKDDIKIENIRVKNNAPNDFIIISGDTIKGEKAIEEFFEEKLNERDEQEAKMTSYLMTFKDETGTQEYEAHLVAIGDEMYLDLFPSSENTDQLTSNLHGLANYIPVHTFMKINIENDYIELVQFNLTKLKDLFKGNLIRMRHEIINDEVLITAQPKEIQKFIRQYSRDPSVFEHSNKYKRVNL